MYKVGLSSTGFKLTEENFIKLQKAGIDSIEVSMKTSEYENIDYKNLKKLSCDYSINLWSYHLPFYPFEYIDISSLNKEVRENTIAYLTGFIKKGAEIGFDKFIIHPSGEPNEDAVRNEKMKYSMESLDRLAEIAGKEGAIIAVEDLPRTCLGHNAEEIAKLISVNDKLKVCLDTNHLTVDNNIDFMKKLANQIVTVHISDYDFIDERHWLPGEGKINWQEFYEEFNKINYNGIWMYEINLGSSGTIKRNRNLEFTDFYKNAQNIFARRDPLSGITLEREYLI